MKGPIKLFVKNPESEEPSLIIIRDNNSNYPMSSNFRVSPVFPAFSDTESSFVPEEQEEFKILFFFCKSPFSTLGILDQQLGSFKTEKRPNLSIRDCFWISHGLASIVLITDDDTSILKVRKIFKGSIRTLRAVETWEVGKEGKIETKIEFCRREVLEPVSFRKWDFLDPDIEEIINECNNCLNTLLYRASLYFPEMCSKIKRIYNDIDKILLKLEGLETDDLTHLPANIQKNIGLSPIYKKEWHHRLTSELIEYSSILSYVISQAFSGHSPILKNETQIRNHSLLGIGNSYKALYTLYDFVSTTFSQLSMKKLVKAYNAVEIEGMTFRNSHAPDNWPSVDLNHLGDLSAINKEHFVYFSGRSGYRETLHAIISALQVIYAADTVRWSLLVNSHEYMHAFVRAILTQLFPNSLLWSKEEIGKRINLYNQMWEPNSIKLKLKEFLQMVCIHYLHLTTHHTNGSGIFKEYKIVARKCMDNLTNADDKNSFDDAISDISDSSKVSHSKITVESFKDILSDEWANINEILTHTLDFIYFYNSDPELYIPSIWLSWSTVPSVMELTEEYVLRTVSVVAGLEKSKNFGFRFRKACNIVEQQLLKIAASKKNLLINRALRIFRCSEAIRLMGFCFYPNIHLVDLVYKYFRSNKILNELHNPGDGFSNAKIAVGSYDLLDISNPVYFIKERLFDKLRNGIIEEDNKVEKYSSLWLLLTCSSHNVDGREVDK